MLYTGKGDKGTTKLFNTPSGVRIPKTAPVFEALGTVDELVAHIGLAKVQSDIKSVMFSDRTVAAILHKSQETLFVLQAELAGAGMSIPAVDLETIEKIISDIEAELPPIKTFFIAGGTELAATLDICRTITRRTERELLRAVESGVVLSETSLAYINRLSSLFYALARHTNHFSGITETPPSYI